MLKVPRLSKTAVFVSILVLLGVSGFAVFEETPISDVVTIDSGPVQGSLTAEGILAFKGIPYAAAPVGDLRWKAPQPVEAWTETRAATEFGASCMQKIDENDAAPTGTPPAEDCLTLNVWRPAEIPEGESLPVLVWIHGGGFVNGSSSAATYDGSALANKGLVFVSFNYRLGRFGFFAHPALTAANEGPLGNYGIMDQLEALRWVQRNIAAFGGDPTKVTIMGESAGGISVFGLITSQAESGLFQRAIVLSGGGRSWLTGGKDLNTGDLSAEETGSNFALTQGIVGTDEAALQNLRSLPAENVVGNLTMTTLLTDPAQMLIYSGGPIQDGTILKSPPGEMIQAGNVAKIPIMVGTTERDLGFVLAISKEQLFSIFGANADQARTLYDPDGQKTLRDLILEVGADIMMQEPARFVANEMTEQGLPAWLYRFYYVAESVRPDTPKANHASELPFVFNTLAAKYGENVTEKDQLTADAIHTYFASFAKGEEPAGDGLAIWPQHDVAQASLMHFSLDNGPIFEPDPWKERLDLVQGLNEENTPNLSYLFPEEEYSLRIKLNTFSR